jgi:hypothetical protein
MDRRLRWVAGCRWNTSEVTVQVNAQQFLNGWAG